MRTRRKRRRQYSPLRMITELLWPDSRFEKMEGQTNGPTDQILNFNIRRWTDVYGQVLNLDSSFKSINESPICNIYFMITRDLKMLQQ